MPTNSVFEALSFRDTYLHELYKRNNNVRNNSKTEYVSTRMDIEIVYQTTDNHKISHKNLYQKLFLTTTDIIFRNWRPSFANWHTINRYNFKAQARLRKTIKKRKLMNMSGYQKNQRAQNSGKDLTKILLADNE